MYAIKINNIFEAENRKPVYPPVDFTDYTDKITIQAEIPGIALEDISVKYGNDKITISGEKKNNLRDNNKHFLNEINYGKFTRSIGIPEYINKNNISANYKNGILEIELQKINKNIEIQHLKV